MCRPDHQANLVRTQTQLPNAKDGSLPVTNLLDPPSTLARFTCASLFVALLAVWCKWAFVGEENSPGSATDLHSYRVPLVLTVGYLVSLPLLRMFTEKFLEKEVDVKLLLTEVMFLYNAAQVVLNGWMVWKFVSALVWGGHPFIGDVFTVNSGTTYAIWVHYCDKYLEFLDTYFMVLRGKMDQVSFLHIYHHVTIAWAWWAAMTIFPGGDSYFGALLNSIIHVMMYSYYAMALLKIHCPWKKYLTMAQLTQFATVLLYTCVSTYMLPSDATWKEYTAMIIQTAEMVSLFILFMHFYRKAYTAKRKQIMKSNNELPDDVATEQVSLSSVSTEDASQTDDGHVTARVATRS